MPGPEEKVQGLVAKILFMWINIRNCQAAIGGIAVSY
jgi:hypothetical protein